MLPKPDRHSTLTERCHQTFAIPTEQENQHTHTLLRWGWSVRHPWTLKSYGTRVTQATIIAKSSDNLPHLAEVGGIFQRGESPPGCACTGGGLGEHTVTWCCAQVRGTGGGLWCLGFVTNDTELSRSIAATMIQSAWKIFITTWATLTCTYTMHNIHKAEHRHPINQWWHVTYLSSICIYPSSKGVTFSNLKNVYCFPCPHHQRLIVRCRDWSSQYTAWTMSWCLCYLDQDIKNVILEWFLTCIQHSSKIKSVTFLRNSTS